MCMVVQVYRCKDKHVCVCTDVQVYKCESFLVRNCTGVQVARYNEVHVCKFAGV